MNIVDIFGWLTGVFVLALLFLVPAWRIVTARYRIRRTLRTQGKLLLGLTTIQRKGNYVLITKVIPKEEI